MNVILECDSTETNAEINAQESFCIVNFITSTNQ